MEAAQQFVAISVVSNVTGFTECYHKADKTLRNPRGLCKDFMEYLYKIKKQAALEGHTKMDPRYAQIRAQIK